MGRHSLPDPDDSGATRRQGPAPDESQTERFGAARHPDEPRPDGQRSGGWDNGEWTGSHRAVTPGRRKISVGVIAALVSVVVIVGAVIMWRFFGDALSSRSQTAAARCVEGEVAVAVVADPAIAEPVTTLAQRYNETAEPVGDKCVKVEVTSADSDQVFNGLTGDWPGDLGQRPALWIPASSASEARLEAKSGPRTVSDSRSLVTSPVVLATSAQLQGAMKDQNWGTVARLQSDPAGLDGLGLQGWGGLRLALPMGQDSDASYLAAEAIAAESAPAGSPPSAGLGAVSTVMAAAPRLDDGNADTAFDALLGADDPATAPVHAVVTTEQRLFQRAAAQPDATKLAAWLPPGPTAVADFPTVLLSGDGLAQEQISAASEFARFLRKPDQLADLAKAGFRAEGQQPPGSDVVTFGPIGPPVDLGDNALRATIADMLASPAQSPTVTVMLDQSMPTDEGGRARLTNVVDALKARLQVLPPDSGAGLWTFDGVAGRSEVALGALSDQVNGQPRSAALTSALDGQSPSDGGAVSFTTLRLAYTDASAKYRDGQKNSVLVITAGPHTDQSLGADGLRQYISGAFDPAKPVAVNVIDFGDDPDRSTWEAVSQTTGGTYQNLSSSSGPELASAITTMMS